MIWRLAGYLEKRDTATFVPSLSITHLSCRIYLCAVRSLRPSTALHVSLLSLLGSLYCIRFEVMLLPPLHSFTYFSLQTQHVDMTSSKTSRSPHVEYGSSKAYGLSGF